MLAGLRAILTLGMMSSLGEELASRKFGGLSSKRDGEQVWGRKANILRERRRTEKEKLGAGGKFEDGGKRLKIALRRWASKE